MYVCSSSFSILHDPELYIKGFFFQGRIYSTLAIHSNKASLEGSWKFKIRKERILDETTEQYIRVAL